jgi:Beta-lactamase
VSSGARCSNLGAVTRFSSFAERICALPSVSVDANALAERIVTLAQPDGLRSELERAFAGDVPSDVVVAFRCDKQSACAGRGRDSVSLGARRVPIRVGCIAKLLTAMLARRAFDSGRLAPDEQATACFRAGPARRALRGVTIRQLLEHTHGLDDSLLSATPRDACGRIDADALVRKLCAVAPLATSGGLYSYGNAGACLVAALLERLDSRRYAVQIEEALLEPIGLRAVGSAGLICPATGRELALDANSLLTLVAESTFAAPDAWPDDERAGDYGFATPLPGWNPLERGVYLGWKYHGAGWIGHQSQWPRESVLVRAHPRRRLVLVAAARDHAAAVVAARVFGAFLPELFDLRVPARPSPSSRPLTGAFHSAAWRVAIHRAGEQHELRARRYDCFYESTATLRLAAPGLWLTRPLLNAFPHVELVERDTDGAYLWNGRFVLRESTD